MEFRSFKVYPRPDEQYKHKHSLDLQMVRSNIFRERHNDVSFRLSSWFNFFMCGLLMGVIAFLIDLIAEFLIDLKWEIA